MSNPIKIIDLFAGPGGLGEGFSAYRPMQKKVFKIAISIEKEASAYRTLLLRSLFRQFGDEDVPEAYYEFLRGGLGKNPEEQLYQLPEVKEQLLLSERESQQLTLGEYSPVKLYKKIRDQIGQDDCVLIGGPPCQAYSIVGRSRNYGARDKEYSASNDHRNFLYLEYLKVIAKFQPKIFVMENVKGILSAKVGGELIFTSILKDLSDPYKATQVKPDKGRLRHNYKIYSFVSKNGVLNSVSTLEAVNDPHDFIIRTENYGVPQARHRVILLGVRDDIANSISDFESLEPSPQQVSVRDVISDLPVLRSRLSKGVDSTNNWRNAIQGIKKGLLNKLSKNSYVADEVYDNFVKNLNGISLSPDSIGSDKGTVKSDLYPICNHLELVQNWYQDKRMGQYVVNHESRGHIVGDLHRYLYYSSYAEVMTKSPTSSNLPKELWPAHKNFESGKFADRFRVQLAELPGTTITSHISKDGHYFIHYDPAQCRSLTVREAARIQTFPDNYYFVGNRTQQYVQVGNAVPPFLAYQLAGVVAKLLG